MSLQKAYYTWPWCDISKQPGCLMNGSPSIWTGKGLEACILMTFPWANLLAWESPTCTDNKHYYHTYRIIFLHWKAKNIHPKFCINMTIKKYFQQKIHIFHLLYIKGKNMYTLLWYVKEHILMIKDAKGCWQLDPWGEGCLDTMCLFEAWLLVIHKIYCDTMHKMISKKNKILCVKLSFFFFTLSYDRR